MCVVAIVRRSNDNVSFPFLGTIRSPSFSSCAQLRPFQAFWLWSFSVNVVKCDPTLQSNLADDRIYRKIIEGTLLDTFVSGIIGYIQHYSTMRTVIYSSAVSLSNRVDGLLLRVRNGCILIISSSHC